MPVQAAGELAQIGETDGRRLDAGGGERRRVQHLERRFEPRDVERKMGPPLDLAEKHQLAAGEPFLDITQTAEWFADMLDREDRGARFGAVDLDDQAVRLPYGHDQRGRIGRAAADPLGVAAAQPGSLETRRGVVVG